MFVNKNNQNKAWTTKDGAAQCSPPPAARPCGAEVLAAGASCVIASASMRPDPIDALLRAEDADLADKYGIIKRRLTENVQTRWCARWPEGNDHGPGHIARVLSNLMAILGPDPIENGHVNAFELFLAATAAVAHDIGIIDGRDLHARRSAELLEIIARPNVFLFDEHSLRVLGAAIECHSSSTDIDEVCQGFSSTESFAGNEVRPKVIAALVRLSDELDEDSRRAERWI
jgi:hypothetical protein